MISRTFSTRTPNSSLMRWNVRYLPARASVCAADSVFRVAVAIDFLQSLVSNIERARRECVQAGVRAPFAGRQRKLDHQIFVVPAEALDDPLGAAHAASLEVPPEHHRRYAQAERPQGLL